MPEYDIVTSVDFGNKSTWDNSAELRRWLAGHIGEPYVAWVTWPAYSDVHESFDKVGVTVYNDKHLTLIALRWA